MNSNNNPSQKEAPDTIPFGIAPEILVSLATGPLLIGVLCGKASLQFLQTLGEASVEVFRGERLPVLHFPTVPSEGAD